MIPEEIEIEIRNAVEAKVKELIINNFPFDDLNNYVGELLRHHLNNTKTNTEQLVKTWHKWCEAHQIDNLSCGMATRKLVEMIEENMSQKVEINDTSKEHVARNDMIMIAAALEVAEQRGMDKVLSRVPSKKEFYDKSDTTTDYIGLDNTPINTDSFYDWILAKLKEPT